MEGMRSKIKSFNQFLFFFFEGWLSVFFQRVLSTFDFPFTRAERCLRTVSSMDETGVRVRG